MNTLSEGTNSEVDSSVQQLRAILERQQKRELCLEEAQEVASSLLSLFEVLAEGDSSDR